MKRVLFVCTGNTCRSSMAEAIARDLLHERNKYAEISVASAGISAMPGDRASFQAVEVMKEWGIDLTGHSARRIGLELMDEADVILAMTQDHKRAVVQFDPESRYKVFTLREYVDGKPGDIQDPFGMPVEVYRKCAEELKAYIEKVLDKLVARQ